MFWLKQPLLHFLLIGLFFFLLFELNASRDRTDSQQSIIVNRDTLIEFIQLRSKTFDRAIANARLEAMMPSDLNQLIREFIKEEVLFREASTLGLDAQDYVIRRRLVQKMEFIIDVELDEIKAPSDDQLEKYFEDNRDLYYLESTVTFAHIFFDKTKYPSDDIVEIAKTVKKKLDFSKATFRDASKHGDPFLYNVNYVESEFDLIASHFGRDLAQELFSSNVVPGVKWQGPYQSRHGLHLIALIEKNPGYFPNASAIKKRLSDDFYYGERKKLIERAIKEKTEKYKIVISYSPFVDIDGAIELSPKINSR